jgi:mannose-6-phosphate isomerase, class I
MSNSVTIYRLEGNVQHYAWGGTQFIPALLQRENPDNKPFAEYWMGAHENVPAVVVKPDGSREPLNQFIQSNPAALLGEPVFRQFGRLPYLFKVLDVKDMLSIQVHPDKKSAAAAFAEENKKGIALNAPDRNYKDDNHKPELMYALSEFWLLHGFKPADALLQQLQAVPELQFLAPVFGKDNYAALYEKVMTMEQQEVNKHLQPLLDRIVPLYNKGLLNKNQEDFWAARAAGTFNQGNQIDRGIFSIYFFNLVHLRPGETIFQDAGIPHAYLEGQNMEIMANSDNVLRGGLTVKHIDVGELMKHVRFEPVNPKVITGTPGSAGSETVFPTPVNDFELRCITLEKDQTIQLKAHTTEIFFVYKGAIAAQSSGTTLSPISAGNAMLAVAGATVELKGMEPSVVFRATVPA